MEEWDFMQRLWGMKELGGGWRMEERWRELGIYSVGWYSCDDLIIYIYVTPQISTLGNVGIYFR